MSKRLQVLMSDSEYAKLAAAAAERQLPVGRYVREVVGRSYGAPKAGSAEAKLAAVRKALQYSFPTADIDQMNEEIELGYRNGLP